MAIKNISASVLARLKNQAKETGLPFQTILQLFAQEEFLRKLSKSEYVNNLILKGGMFIYTLTEFDSRPTKDVDFMLRNMDGDIANIKSVMEDICSVDTGNDFMNMKVISADEIGIEKEYPGTRINFMVNIDNVRIPFSIDIGIDDVIVPEAVSRQIVTRLDDFSKPEVFTYSLESTIAEKFDSIINRMEGTSRMKDFHDIYYLSGMFDFEGGLLLEAVKSTLKHRKRENLEETFKSIDDLKNSDVLHIRWNAYQKEVKTDITFDDTIEIIQEFLGPMFEPVLEDGSFNKKWNAMQQSWI